MKKQIKKTKEKNWRVVKLGVVGVDSGMLMITDPCYLDGWKANQYNEKRLERDKGKYSYNGCCATNNNRRHGGQLNFEFGQKSFKGQGVSFDSGFGDGLYKVEALLQKTPWGERITKVLITLITDKEMRLMKAVCKKSSRKD